MRRKPTSPSEELFVRYLDIILLDLLGTPDPGRGGQDEVHYLGCNINVGSNEERRGTYRHWRSGNSGAGFDMLAQLDLTRSDVEAWLRGVRPAERPERETDAVRAAERAKRFAILEENSRADDGRIAKYLAGRGLPETLASLLAITTVPRRNRAGEWEPGGWAMVSWAVDDEGTRQAGQVLEMAPNGDFKKAIDGKKVRLTYSKESGWASTAAFRIAAEPGSPEAAAVLVEGTEDALAVRACGYPGPIYAVLGKGNFQKFSPPGEAVLLLADRDVSVAELDAIVEFHVSAGREVRRVILPDGLKDAGEAPAKDMAVEMLEAINGAEVYRSPSGELNQALSTYAFDSAGESKFEAEVVALAKRLGLGLRHIRARRKEQREAHKRHEKARKEAEEKAAEGGLGDRTFIMPWAEKVTNIEAVMDELLAHLRRYIVTPFDHHVAIIILWSMHAQSYRTWKITPRLYLRSLVNESGKTTILNAIMLLTPGAEQYIKSSGPGLYRGLDEAYKSGDELVPLIDEIDGMFTESTTEDANLRKLFNNNETGRFSKKILLVEEQVVGRARKHVSQRVHAMAPIALAGMDRLPSSMKSRCIEIRQQRYTPEVTTGFDEAKIGEYASKLRRWMQDNHSTFKADPDLPPLKRKPTPRTVDKWKPILAIANVIGGKWPEYVRRSMDRAARRDQSLNADTRVILDIRRIFDARRAHKGRWADVIMSTELAEALAQEVSGKSAYAEISTSGNARTQWLADRMDEWDISPRRPRKVSVEYPGAGVRSSFYFREDFEGVWTRHNVDDVRAHEDDLSEELPPGFTFPEGGAARPGATSGPRPAENGPRSAENNPRPAENGSVADPPVSPSEEGVDAGGRGLKGPSTNEENYICDPAEGVKTPETPNVISFIGAGGPLPPSTRVQEVAPLPFPVFGRGSLRSIHPVHRIPENLRLRVQVDEDGIPTWTLGGAQPMPHWVERLAQHLRGLQDRLAEAKAKANGAEKSS